MKISAGKYVDQFAIGVTWLRYPHFAWSVIFDFGLWYVEVSKDFNDNVDWNPYGLSNTLECDRCGSPNDVYHHINEKLDSELVCAECLRYEDYMNNLGNEESKDAD